MPFIFSDRLAKIIVDNSTFPQMICWYTINNDANDARGAEYYYFIILHTIDLPWQKSQSKEQWTIHETLHEKFEYN